MDILILLLGLLVLIVGGELLVRGAVGLSTAMRISPLVIGMTVVSFGTSAPELLVSLQSALNGNPGIAIGNVVGSNIANITLVLGITVVIFPIVAEKQTKRIDFPMMLFSTLLFVLFALNGVIEFWEGLVMVAVLIGFTVFLIRESRRSGLKEIETGPDEDKKETEKVIPTKVAVIYLIGGLVALYFGSDWFVNGAVNMAKSFGLSDSIIGVTVVALGTSAPELVASIMAALKKQSDISIGNLVGSNVFNIFAVLGFTSIVTPIKVDPMVLSFDMWWVVGTALILIPVIYLGVKIGKWKGVLLISSYFAYILLIVLKIKGVI